MTASLPLLSRLALSAIRFYQRHLSPLKGFSCAYRVHTGRASCSGLGFRAIRRYGVRRGLGVLRERTHLCGVAYRRYRPVVPCRRPHAQAGFCDAGCDVPVGDCGTPSCDLPTCELPSCDLPGCQIQSCAPPNPCEGHDCARPCDSPGTSAAHQGSRCPSLCDVLDCASGCGDCDWPDRRHKNAEDERHIHIPPRPSAETP